MTPTGRSAGKCTRHIKDSGKCAWHTKEMQGIVAQEVIARPAKVIDEGETRRVRGQAHPQKGACPPKFQRRGMPELRGKGVRNPP